MRAASHLSSHSAFDCTFLDMAGWRRELLVLVLLACAFVADAYPGPFPLPGPWANPFPLPSPLPGPVPLPNPHPGPFPLPGPLPGPISYPGPIPLPGLRPHSPDTRPYSPAPFPDPFPDTRPHSPAPFPDPFPDTRPYSPAPFPAPFPDTRPYPQSDPSPFPFDADPFFPRFPLNEAADLQPKWRSLASPNTVQDLQHASYPFTHSDLPHAFPLDLEPRHGVQFEGEMVPRLDYGGRKGYLQPRQNQLLNHHYRKSAHDPSDWFAIGLPSTVPQPLPIIRFVRDFHPVVPYGGEDPYFEGFNQGWNQPDDAFGHNALQRQRFDW
ncbi:putative uncharacterized protein DDB_G0290521 [Penaeus japonicus]|uniref:putative uncharacterized protein DDB_G0290521 n=1 Tax=Penaeus japonicus TaxID=27405 RepID=UPI001C70FFEF|nr:putative uncharacterized protein DDB_G0290521 [Penaeus japonicus]